MENITDSELLKIAENWGKEQPINIGIKTAFAAGYRMAEIKVKNCTIPDVSGSLPEVTLMNEQKLGDTFINWKELSPEKQWQRIDAMLHEIGLKVVRQ